MKVLFVTSFSDVLWRKRPLRRQEQMQFGISYISSLLKAHGHSTRLMVLSRVFGRKNRETVDKVFEEFSPRLVCFSAVYTEYPFIAATAQYVRKRYPQAFLLIGGPHASLNPEEVLSGCFDALCIGEGEHPTLELVSRLEKDEPYSDIPNLWFRDGPHIRKNAPRPFLSDLDELPFPDREMWQEWMDEEDASTHPVLLGRGCPFECAYCCNHAFSRLAEGPYVRLRSTENILREIRQVTERYPRKKAIYLEVETIGTDKQWTLELCSKLKRLNSTLESPLSFGVNVRVAPNIDYRALFEAFEGSNVQTINIGIESGSERVRREILNRRYSNQDIADVVALAREHHLRVNVYNLIGVPGETLEDFKQTVAINRTCQPDTLYNSIFFPYPGTRLYSLCKENGLLNGKLKLDSERLEAVLDLPGFRKEQVERCFVWFYFHVYRGHKPVHRLLLKTLWSKCRSDAMLQGVYRKLVHFF